MGPPKFIGGNTAKLQRRSAKSALQWGRRNSSAEIGMNLNAQYRNAVASMGPPKFIGGNIGYGGGDTGRPHASMGPPKFIGGNDDKERAAGNEQVLQWGRRNSSAEIYAVREAPAHVVLLQWGRRNSSAEIQIRDGLQHKRDCFNGAAEIHRRKFHIPAAPTRDKIASMGPPKFIGGNTLTGVARCMKNISFNGAAEIHRRKFC